MSMKLRLLIIGVLSLQESYLALPEYGIAIGHFDRINNVHIKKIGEQKLAYTRGARAE